MSMTDPIGDLITRRLPLDGLLDGLNAIREGSVIKVTIEP